VRQVRDFLFKITIMIAIENYSGKNGIRFSFFDRVAFFLRKTLCDFFVKTGSRLNCLPAGEVVVVERAGSCMHK